MLLFQSKQVEKQLDERKQATGDLEKQVALACSELKESKKSRKKLEDQLSENEVSTVCGNCTSVPAVPVLRKVLLTFDFGPKLSKVDVFAFCCKLISLVISCRAYATR